MHRTLLLAILLGALAWGLYASADFTEIAAGIAVFLLGMMGLEQGFKSFTGGTLERLLRASTDRIWKGLAFGAVATALTQSSSLVTMMTISFLSAGLLTLTQGIGVIFGANLGTTTGAWLIAGFGLHVNIGAWALPLLVFGVALSFHRSRTWRGLGQILTGVGFLFLGIQFMKDGFEAFQGQIDLTAYAVAGVPGLLLFTALGIVATVIMQSSHATLLLTITALAGGQLTYENALALSIGANVGTTVTALIGAIGANLEGRRLAGAHLVFNLVTGLVALVFIGGFVYLVEVVAGVLGISEGNMTLRLALFHTLFNLTGIVLMVPLTGHLVRVLEQVLKPRSVVLTKARYVSENMIDMPGAALEAVRRELMRLFKRVFALVARTLNYEPFELREAVGPEPLMEPPEFIHATDVDGLYLRRIKPLHGIILDFLPRVTVQGVRARQAAQLRNAARQLMEAVKDVKHLQKNLVPGLASTNSELRREYLKIRANLAWLLHRLDAVREEAPEDVAAELEDLAGEAERNDIVANGQLDRLIRDRAIRSENATSLMNDSAYVNRITRNLLEFARVAFIPFEPGSEDEQDPAGP